ncbi:MAG: riboflavin synthase [Gemmatimonadales bacterium]|nr:MAG: riboflavin synthase [Gemmatimonadales bacterium]
MFTGIIEQVGRIAAVQEREGLRRLEVDVDPAFLEGVKPGDSIAVDGACLTPVEVGVRTFVVQVVASTLGRTLAGGYAAGDRVNLERAMRLGARLDGHLVQGHVDGPGELTSVRREGDTVFLEFRIPREVHRATIPYGSVALNGISLTVNALREPDLLEVAIIPHTWAHTNLAELEPGGRVNVEGDLIGKYVGRLLPSNPSQPQGTD